MRIFIDAYSNVLDGSSTKKNRLMENFVMKHRDWSKSPLLTSVATIGIDHLNLTDCIILFIIVILINNA